MEKYQTFWRRAGAAFLDSVVLMLVNWGVALTFVLLQNLNPPGFLPTAASGLVSALYFILMHYYGGQTLGKMAARVKVVDDSEVPINLGQSIIRNLPQLLPVMFAVSFSTADDSSARFWASLVYGLTFVFSIANVIVCLVNEKHRALHDLIAGTVVVRTDA